MPCWRGPSSHSLSIQKPWGLLVSPGVALVAGVSPRLRMSWPWVRRLSLSWRRAKRVERASSGVPVSRVWPRAGTRPAEAAEAAGGQALNLAGFAAAGLQGKAAGGAEPFAGQAAQGGRGQVHARRQAGDAGRGRGDAAGFVVADPAAGQRQAALAQGERAAAFTRAEAAVEREGAVVGGVKQAVDGEGGLGLAFGVEGLGAEAGFEAQEARPAGFVVFEAAFVVVDGSEAFDDAVLVAGVGGCFSVVGRGSNRRGRSSRGSSGRGRLRVQARRERAEKGQQAAGRPARQGHGATKLASSGRRLAPHSRLPLTLSGKRISGAVLPFSGTGLSATRRVSPGRMGRSAGGISNWGAADGGVDDAADAPADGEADVALHFGRVEAFDHEGEAAFARRRAGGWVDLEAVAVARTGFDAQLAALDGDPGD